MIFMRSLRPSTSLYCWMTAQHGQQKLEQKSPQGPPLISLSRNLRIALRCRQPRLDHSVSRRVQKTQNLESAEKSRCSPCSRGAAELMEANLHETPSTGHIE